MRYIDSGADAPDQSLGFWLTQTLQVPDVLALRWQTGYFDADGLGPMLPVLAAAARDDLLVRAVIGSNEGQTPAADVRRLLSFAGAPRANASVGIVSYTGGLFHPKVVHVLRRDGSQAAYIGSANLTEAGVSSRNIEAGITLDSREDPPAVLQDIAARIDRWFAAPVPLGLSLVEPASVDALVAAGVLANARPPRPPARPAAPGAAGAAARPRRQPIFALPPVPEDAQAAIGPAPAPAAAPAQPPPPAGVIAAPPAPPVAARGPLVWQKVLSNTDAQRQAGHHTGDLRLVQARFMVGGRVIDQTTYFRRTLFGGFVWRTTTNPQGRLVEMTDVAFDITILGQSLGRRTLTVSHKPTGEAGQGNYTTSLRWGPVVQAHNVAGRTLRLYAPPAGQRAPFVIDIS